MITSKTKWEIELGYDDMEHLVKALELYANKNKKNDDIRFMKDFFKGSLERVTNRE